MTDLYLAQVNAPYYFFRTDELETRLPLEENGTVDLGSVELAEVTQAFRAARGEPTAEEPIRVKAGRPPSLGPHNAASVRKIG